jgi:hypothetical protein
MQLMLFKQSMRQEKGEGMKIKTSPVFSGLVGNQRHARASRLRYEGLCTKTLTGIRKNILVQALSELILLRASFCFPVEEYGVKQKKR